MTDNTELIRLLGTQFIQRRDVKSFQNSKGEWHPAKCDACRESGDTCLHRPMTLQDFEDHLAGKHTMGHYLVSPTDQTCKLFAFDLDIRKPDPKVNYEPKSIDGMPYNPREAWLLDSHPMRPHLIQQVRCLAEGLALRVARTMGIPVAIADSGGKGFHVYCFTGVIPAEAARSLAHGSLESWGCFTAVRGKNFWQHNNPEEYPDVEIETFPKQATVSESGMGNLMKLPLGVNRKTGKPSKFITTRSSTTTIVEMDPLRALGGDYPWE